MLCLCFMEFAYFVLQDDVDLYYLTLSYDHDCMLQSSPMASAVTSRLCFEDVCTPFEKEVYFKKKECLAYQQS